MKIQDIYNQKDHRTVYEAVPLEELFPKGMFSESESEWSKNALEAFRIIESLLKENAQDITVRARFSAFQEFFRNGNKEEYRSLHRQLLKSLSPEWYWDFIEEINDHEVEVFLKFYVHAHELWGKSEGVRLLLKTMLESVAKQKIPVNVISHQRQSREIPDHMRSRLGERYSIIGKDFVPGRSYWGKPDHYEIHVGPIYMDTLVDFQNAGWAIESEASEKLYKLASFAEPYYMKSRIRIILAMRGFKLGMSRLKEDKLGSVVDMENYKMKKLGIDT